jgi:hypothetical protein
VIDKEVGKTGRRREERERENKPPYNSPVASTTIQKLAIGSFRIIIVQIHSASGPAPNTVSNSKLTTVKSAPPHLLSAFA